MKFFLFCLLLMIFNNVFSQKKTQKKILNKKVSIVVNNNPYLLHIVKNGDTYNSIAAMNNLTVEKLYILNAIDKNNTLLVGTSLFIKDLTGKRKIRNNKNNF